MSLFEILANLGGCGPATSLVYSRHCLRYLWVEDLCSPLQVAAFVVRRATAKNLNGVALRTLLKQNSDGAPSKASDEQCVQVGLPSTSAHSRDRGPKAKRVVRGGGGGRVRVGKNECVVRGHAPSGISSPTVAGNALGNLEMSCFFIVVCNG